MSFTKPFKTAVAGVTWAPGYPTNLYRIDMDMDERGHQFPVHLVRNPQNEADSNAIEVHTEMDDADMMLGHIPAALASRLAPMMDAGQGWDGWVSEVLVNKDAAGRPGVRIHLQPR